VLNVKPNKIGAQISHGTMVLRARRHTNDIPGLVSLYLRARRKPARTTNAGTEKSERVANTR
jgi:hypothetical protein